MILRVRKRLLVAFGTLGVLAIVATSAAAQTVLVTRGPYLQQGTPTSVIVVWRTLLPRDSRVVYGSSPSQLNQTAQDPTSVTQHEVRITGLTPNTRYYYAVGTSSELVAGGDGDHYFVTAPPVGTRQRFRMWIVGDSGTGGLAQAAVRDAMLQATIGDRPNLFLHMGDMAYSDGTDLEFQLRFFLAYFDLLKNTVCWPTMGNHEGHNSDSGTQTGPYYDAYVLPKNAEAGGLPSGTEAYYSFDYANVHFIVLDSHDSPRAADGAMLGWLKDDLAATSADWIIAYWHHPPYTKGSHDSDAEGQLIEMRENALPILEAGGVDLVLGGHSHIYERSWLINGAYATPTTSRDAILNAGDGRPTGDGAYRKRAGLNANGGTVYVVAGHGGASLNQVGSHPLMYFTEEKHGSCLLDIDGNTLSMRNVRSDGVVSDHFTLIKGTGTVADGGFFDGGVPGDGGLPADAGTPAPDGGPLADAGTVVDAGTVPDGGLVGDGGTGASDGGGTASTVRGGGCAVSGSAGARPVVLLLALLLAFRLRRRRTPDR